VCGAAWALSESDHPARSVWLAQAVATGNAVEVVSDAIQLHGGIGVTWECHLHPYLRRAKLSSRHKGHRQHIAKYRCSLLDR
jgi:alkylation response protein AidB-like acyl-CoA dehydrogenase